MSVPIPSLESPLMQPKIMSAFRRFGRYDDFNPVNSSVSSLGSKSIGKINIDCQFEFKKSKWGTLHGHPGGIMYLNLNFGPPSGCRVSNATVTITLDGHDQCLRPYIASRPREESHFSRIPVRMTEWYGPQCMGGEKKSAEYAFTTKAVPEANILGYGVGGIGYEKYKALKKEARWSFNGQLLRGERTTVYTSLRWDLNENELEGQSFHNPKFQTAFAFEHSGQPFIMKVKIEGKLAKWHHQIKSKLKFDGAKDGNVVTLVDFQDHRRFSHGLDRTAQDLGLAMEMENLHQTPIEIPDSMPRITSQEVSSGTPQQPSGPTNKTSVVNQAVETSQTFLGNNSDHPKPQSSEQSQRTGRWTPDIRKGDRPTPGVEDYRKILAQFSHRPILRPLGDDPSYTSASNTSTLVDAGNASEDLDKTHEASDPTAGQTDLAENSRKKTDDRSPEVDHDAMLRILSGIPGMLVILQFLASIMRPWSSGNPDNGARLANTIHQVGTNSPGTTLGSEATIQSRKGRIDEGPEES